MALPTIGASLELGVEAYEYKPRAYKEELPIINSDAIIGIEVELEQHELVKSPPKVWIPKEDGSLRNNGMEYVSHPIKARVAPAALKELFVDSLNASCSFSLRTSIHVHINVLDLTTQQMQALVLLYSVYEDIFYKYAGRGRWKNIYCVPITQTDLLTYFMENQLKLKWEKYTGLNLRRMADLGTIEFRHLAGTNSAESICHWIGIICAFRDFIINHSDIPGLIKQIEELDERSDYMQLLQDIIGPYMQYVKFLEPSVYFKSALKVKTAFLKRNHTRTFEAALTTESPLYQTYRRVAV